MRISHRAIISLSRRLPQGQPERPSPAPDRYTFRRAKVSCSHRRLYMPHLSEMDVKQMKDSVRASIHMKDGKPFEGSRYYKDLRIR
jgi:hypothetical protein